MSDTVAFETLPPLLSPGALVGRVPPHSVEAEALLLSCCLLDGRDTVSRCIENRISPKSFYVPANQVIFGTLLDLYNRGEAIDRMTLCGELETSRQLEEVGGHAYLNRVNQTLPTTAQAAYFVEKVRELHLLRELIRAATATVEGCYEYTGGLREFVDKVERDIFRVTQERVGDGAKPVCEAVDGAVESFRVMSENRGTLEGLSSGYPDIDRFTSGMKPDELFILSGRPSCGKTALALNIAENVAMPLRGDPVGVLVFSLEMPALALTKRLLATRSKVSHEMLKAGLIKRGGAEWARVESVANELRCASLFIDDQPSPTVMEIRAKARRVHMRHGVGLVVVDYLQLVSALDPKALREQQVAEASRGLKALARELGVPVLVLCQLNRSAERENRAPRLSDLRESGSIEQDADVVLMLSRPKDADDKFQVAGDVMDLFIAKNRNGSVGDVKLTFMRNITRFESYHGG
ncbi:replicative DNA helicase [Opitutaceae bacterium TAV1]|nr:replicative DNA helicase [Opitutaceae bacterium TAV1]